MILVLSFDIYEQGTDPVIDWLIYLKADFKKISIYDLLNHRWNYSIQVDTGTMTINGEPLPPIHAIWYRRFFHDFNLQNDSRYYSKLNAEVKIEVQTLVYYLQKLFAGKKWMPSYDSYQLNKLEALHLAKACGLYVPRTEIINNQKDLLAFLDTTPQGLITKAMTDESKSYYLDGEYSYFSFTKDMTAEDCQALEPFFFPSLFQEKIDVDFEIRLFYLDGDCYATAILNSDQNRETDRKKYHNATRTHQIRYKLPDEVEDRVRAFMTRANLNTGSLDILKSRDNRYYFLEVNMVGQYSAQSMKCNYNLDKKIAEWLIKHDTYAQETRTPALQRSNY